MSTLETPEVMAERWADYVGPLDEVGRYAAAIRADRAGIASLCSQMARNAVQEAIKQEAAATVTMQHGDVGAATDRACKASAAAGAYAALLSVVEALQEA